jgi:hypothetical protein
MGLGIAQTVLGSNRAGQDDFLIHVFDVSGATAESRIGLLIDWELHDGLDESNRIHFDPASGLLHVEEEPTSGDSVAGMVVLESPGALSWSWFHDVADEDQTQPALYTGADLGRKLSDAALWQLMTEHAPDQGSEPGGVGSVLAAGPRRVRSAFPWPTSSAETVPNCATRPPGPSGSTEACAPSWMGSDSKRISLATRPIRSTPGPRSGLRSPVRPASGSNSSICGAEECADSCPGPFPVASTP